MQTLILSLLTCLSLLAGGPVKDYEADMKAAIEKGVRLTLKADAPDNVKQVWEAWVATRDAQVADAKKQVDRLKSELMHVKDGNINPKRVAESNSQSAEQLHKMGVRTTYPNYKTAQDGDRWYFSDLETKKQTIASKQRQFDDATAQLKGLKGGTIVVLDDLWNNTTQPSKEESKIGKIGTVKEPFVRSVMNENELLASEAVTDGLVYFVVTDYSTDGLVDDSKASSFQAEVVGTRTLNVVQGGATMSKTVFVLKTFSIYDYLEPDDDKSAKKPQSKAQPKQK